MRGGRLIHQVGPQSHLHLGDTSLPCLDPKNSACMVSLTKMADVGEMLTRGCCALEDKNYIGQLCRGGQVMKTKYGSVREVNCKQDNCNTETMKDRVRDKDKDEDKNLEVKKKTHRQKEAQDDVKSGSRSRSTSGIFSFFLLLNLFVL